MVNRKLLQGNSFEMLRLYPTESVQLVVTSPPYNIGKEYESKATLDDYLAQFPDMIQHLHRIITKSGSVCWQVGNYIHKGEVYPLDIYFYNLFKAAGFQLRNRMIWHFGHGLHCSKRFSGRYETLLWFTKSDDYKFNLDPVRVPSKYPNKKHYKGDKKGELSGNPLGKNPSDVWSLDVEWSCGFWDVPNVKNNHPEKGDHPCQFPVELPERCVLALTDAGDHVLDPFCGIGSTLVAAIKNGRSATGMDQTLSYLATAQSRLDDLADGTLRLRELGKSVYQPK